MSNAGLKLINFDSAQLLAESTRLVEIFIEILKSSNPQLAAALPLPGEYETSAPEFHIDDEKSCENYIQACSIYFNLLNVAEEFCINSKRGAGSRNPLPGQTDSNALKISVEQLGGLLRQMEVELVITAHPTEAKRITVLEIHKRIYESLAQLHRGHSPVRENDIREKLQADIEILWQTGNIFLEKPRVQDEVENGLFYFKESFYPTVSGVLKDLYRSLADSLSQDMDILPLLRFASWRGGDRDGNPFVTADVTRHTLVRHACFILELYIQDVAELIRLLSQSSLEIAVSRELLSSLAVDSGLLADYELLRKRNPNEPYRLKMAVILRRLQIRLECIRSNAPQANWKAGAYQNVQEFLHDIETVRRSLEANGGQHAAKVYVRQFELNVRTFEFHLAKLDVRENSNVINEALAALIPDRKDYQRLSLPQRQEWLDSALALPANPIIVGQNCSNSTHQVLDTLKVVLWARSQLNSKAVGSYIVSMTRDVSDLLAVYYLFKQIGVWERGGCPIPIVPLFETIEDLQRAPEILRKLFSVPAVQNSLSMLGMQQEVMIGYSDSNKDGGFTAANWMLFEAQRNMQQAASSSGVTLKFFHGIGGSLSRGGRPIQRTIQALPSGTLLGRIKITEQGETISTKYANRETARLNLNTLVSSVMAASAENMVCSPNISEDFSDEMRMLTRDSYTAYRSLLEDPDFISYFRWCSPIEVIGNLNMGSRPARRKASEKIEDLRAIPWVFSWTQNRHLISGWYGAGSAFEQAASSPERLERLRRMYCQWGFFKNLVMALRVNLLMADMNIAQHYSRLCPDPGVRSRIWLKIQQEYDRTAANVLLVTNGTSLQEEHPHFSFTSSLRFPLLKEMNLLQVRLLEKAHQGTVSPEHLTNLLLSINCIAAGLKNTG